MLSSFQAHSASHYKSFLKHTPSSQVISCACRGKANQHLKCQVNLLHNMPSQQEHAQHASSASPQNIHGHHSPTNDSITATVCIKRINGINHDSCIYCASCINIINCKRTRRGRPIQPAIWRPCTKLPQPQSAEETHRDQGPLTITANTP